VCTVGVHPNYCNEVADDAVESLRPLLTHDCVVAVGEMGLDYHWKTVDPARQATFFRQQLMLARDVDKPIVIHSREAIADSLAILREFPGVVGVFHSFTGTPDEARAIVEQGFFIGFTGPVTYKKNDALREAARLVPMDRIVVETDAPYLSPEPMRSQKINEPALVMHVARRLADDRGMSLTEFDRITTDNARRLFRLRS
jgi:TatD DNase family protein